MKTRALLLLSLLTLFSAGCSNSWREGDSGRSSEEVGAYLDEVQNAQTNSTGTGVGSDVTSVLQMRDQSDIYFAEAPGDLGPVGSIVSFVDFSFLGLPQISIANISQARVFFFDASPNYGLLIGLDIGQGFQYYGFTGTGSFDGDFQAELSGTAGTIVLQSDDTDGSSLDDVIQLHMYFNGEYIGKFSTLVGYTQ